MPRPGLKLCILKQLAEDIEETGGIERFRKKDPTQGLALLCDCKKNIYGERGAALRRQIQQKVYRWAKLVKPDYDKKVLRPLNVKPFSERVSERLKSNKAPISSEPAKNDPVTASSKPSKDKTPPSCQPTPTTKISIDTAATSQTPPKQTASIVSKPTPQRESAPKPTPQREKSPSIVASLKTTTAKTINMSNELGDIIKLDLDDGLTFVILWVDTKLDSNLLQLVIAEDGLSVKMRTKKPCPPDATAMLNHYSWCHDKKNFVIKSLNAELKRLKMKTKPSEEWQETDVLFLQEQVIKKFVDIDGHPTNKVGFKTHASGRQTVTFFLKAVNAEEEAPSAATFSNVGGATSGNNGPSGMDIGGGDDDSLEETVTESVRQEMDELRSAISNQHRQQMDSQRQQMEQHRQQMEFQQKQMEQQMQQQMQFMQQMMMHLKVQAQPQHHGVPDDVASHMSGMSGPAQDAFVQAQAEADAVSNEYWPEDDIPTMISLGRDIVEFMDCLTVSQPK